MKLKNENGALIIRISNYMYSKREYADFHSASLPKTLQHIVYTVFTKIWVQGNKSPEFSNLGFVPNEKLDCSILV